MEHKLRKIIAGILIEKSDVLRIPIRQKSKFEGWLKFELANKLMDLGYKEVKVEEKNKYNHFRSDVSFDNDYYRYKVELKTPNTNWRQPLVNESTRPITKNIKSIIEDAKKLNSSYGIVAFVLFPVPTNDTRWYSYIERLRDALDLDISVDKNCSVVNIEFSPNYFTDLIVCTFKSKRYNNYSFD